MAKDKARERHKKLHLDFDKEPGPSANDTQAWSPLRESPRRRNAAARLSKEKMNSTDRFVSTDKFESFNKDQSGVKNYEGVKV